MKWGQLNFIPSVSESLTQRRGTTFPNILSRELTKPQQSRLTCKTSTTYPAINLVWVPCLINIWPTRLQNCSYQVMPDRTWTASKGTENKEQTNKIKNKKINTFNECKSTVFFPGGEGGYCHNIVWATGMCCCEGWIGYINQSVWVYSRVSFFTKLTSWLKILSQLRKPGIAAQKYKKVNSAIL